MLRFPFSVFGLLVAFLLVAERSWGQAVPESLAQVLRQYRPIPLATLGATLSLGRGTVQLPPQAIQRRTGTKDSDRGEIRSAGLLIGYDIGRMAGIHVGAHNRGGNPFTWGNPLPFSTYEERTVSSVPATLGLRPSQDGPEVVATLQAPGRSLDDSAVSYPANFWAVVHTEAELQQFLAVVFSYRPAAKP